MNVLDIRKFLYRLKKNHINVYIKNDKLIVDAEEEFFDSDDYAIIINNKDEIKHFFRNEAINTFFTIEPEEKKDYYQLSSAQKRLYLLQQMELNNTAYNVSNLMPLGEEVDSTRIEEVFCKLVSRHESFRTSIGLLGEIPVQRVNNKVDFKVERITIEKSEEQIIRKRFIQAFNLSQAPLIRVTMVSIKGEGNILLIDMHHIISDGVSSKILEEEFQKLYNGEKLQPLRLQYKDYSEWQNSVEHQLKVKEQENYWIKQFEEGIPVLNLPTDYNRTPIQNHQGASVKFALSKEETENIKSLARENGLTLYMSILSALTILLSKLSGQEDIIVGTPIVGRNHNDLGQIVGMFVNTLAIRNRVVGSDTLKEFLEKVKQITIEAYEHQDYQFEDLVEKLLVNRDTSRHPIFDVVFNMRNQDTYSDDLSGLVEKRLVHNPIISKFDLSIAAMDYGAQILLRIEYCTKLFRPESIENYIKYFSQIIRQLPDKIHDELSNIELLSVEERKTLLHELIKESMVLPKDKTIFQRIDEQAEKAPNNIAIVTKEGQFTYLELNKKSNQLAHHLRGLGVENSVVGLCFYPSIEMIISILSIIKSGGAFLPISPETPIDRLSYILKDSGSNLLLVDYTVAKEALTDTNVNLLEVKNIILDENFDNLIKVNNENDPVYIIYTSGTTGNPKGVIVTQRNLLNYFLWFESMSSISSEDTTALLTSYAFDLGYTGLFSSLIYGGKLHLLQKDLFMTPNLLVNYIVKNRLTYLKLTSSLFTTLINEDQFEQALRNLRLLVLGGEEINVNAVKLSISLNNNIEIVNHYGPTECTIGCVTHRINKRNLEQFLSKPVIGKPIYNMNAYVLNSNHQIQPRMVSEELYISGAGVALGYINNPELTFERFIKNSKSNGEGIYRTGDKARMLSDGSIEFLGRIDNQVKIRGYRIELGEIETVLLRHDRIQESIVIVRGDNEDKYLCAYIVGKKEIDKVELNSYLTKILPNYMIPSFIVEMDKLPLTQNGKVNLKELPAPVISLNTNYIEPENDIEEKLVSIWAEVLNIDKASISTNSNFFSLGGQSLKSTVLVSKIHRVFNVIVPLTFIFSNPNIISIANYINKANTHSFISILPSKEKDYYNLSFNQQRLWLIKKYYPEEVYYNILKIISFNQEVKVDDIKHVIELLIKRHDILNTSIKEIDGNPCQFILNTIKIPLEVIDLSSFLKEDKHDKLVELQNKLDNYIFNFAEGPLFNCKLVKLEDAEYQFFFCMHHIITDGISIDILGDEFNQLYNGIRDDEKVELPILEIQYKDFAEWQINQVNNCNKINDSFNYWKTKIEDGFPELILPFEIKISTLPLQCEGYKRIINSELKDKLLKLAHKNNTTISTVLYTSYNIILALLSKQKDIVAPIAVSGRDHEQVKNMVGYFSNSILIKNRIDVTQDFEQILKHVNLNVLEGLQNMSYPMELVINYLNVEYPVLSNIFNMINYHKDTPKSLNEEDFIVTKVSGLKFKFSVVAFEYSNSIVITWNYKKEIYDKQSIIYMADSFYRLLSTIVE